MAGKGPIPPHSTETSDRPWNGSRNEARLRDDPKSLRRAHAWVDRDGDPANKTSYKFIHHEADKDGRPGAANERANINGVAVLNGGRGGANIPETDRPGVYKHLAKHLRDAGKEPAPLKEPARSARRN